MKKWIIIIFLYIKDELHYIKQPIMKEIEKSYLKNIM